MTGSRGRRPRWVRAALAALSAALAAGCAGGQRAGAGTAEGGVVVGQAAPEVALTDLAGKTVPLSSLRGKVVLLDVWASWCEPCKQELPVLDELALRLRPRGVEVVAVSIDEDRRNVDRFLATRDRWSLSVMHDPKAKVGDLFQPTKMPSSYVIDRAGIVRYVNGGFVPEDAGRIEAQLVEIVARPAP